jgi:molybdopterin-guanine dinucleotide biosynthesis protein A
MKTTGVLLAGGRATRFGGRPKGLALYKEQRIADRVLIALTGATDRQVVVSNDPEADDWFPKLRVVPDDEPGLGPLAGIETGLIAAKDAPVVIVAWDMPFVSAPLLRGMRALGELGADAVVPVHGAGEIVEALCAWYSAAARPVVRELLAHGERRAAALRVLEQHGETMEKLFMSIDSPEQLAAIGGSFPAI